MPATAQGFSGGITVRGGRKLRRFITRLNDPRVTGEAVARALASVLRREIIPSVLPALPRRTGRLRQSVRVVQRDASVEIRAVFYGRWVPVGPQRIPLAEYIVDRLEDHRDAIRDAVERELRTALGI